MDEPLVLGRVVHFFDAAVNECSTAIVIHVEVDAEGVATESVTLKGWDHEGNGFVRSRVELVYWPTTTSGTTSFHFTRSCQWHR